MEELPDTCEQCGDAGIGFTDDGEFLCEDCLFESFMDEQLGLGT